MKLSHFSFALLLAPLAAWAASQPASPTAPPAPVVDLQKNPANAASTSAPAPVVATPDPATAAAAEAAKIKKSTADHSRFKQLDKAFKSVPEVTKACLECHTEASKQIHTSKHWKWEFTNPVDGKKVGKKNMVNNFCTATTSNEKGCTSCHIGYGWKDNVSFDFKSEENVDCVVCHDTAPARRRSPLRRPAPGGAAATAGERGAGRRLVGRRLVGRAAAA